MKISGLRRVAAGDRVRAEAEIEWETRPLPTRTLYFETSADHADDFEASADAFLLACVPLATWQGEERVALRGPVCPLLYENARACSLVMQRFHPELRPPQIEVELGFEAAVPRTPARTAAMMSGGVDALATLRTNRLEYPLDHPYAIRECLCFFGLYGFDHDENGPVPERLAAWRDLHGRLEGLAARERFTLVPVYTNVRFFSPDYLAWSVALNSALSVAGAHCLARRFDRLLLASDGAGVESPDCSSSQYLCGNFSSAGLDVRLELVASDRLERVRLLSRWDEALALMQPCHWVEVPTPGQVNCGRCEKCIRTMLCLLIAGKLAEASAFPADDVRPGDLLQLWLPTENKLTAAEKLAEPLRRIGRRDLARALHRLARRTRRRPEG